MIISQFIYGKFASLTTEEYNVIAFHNFCSIYEKTELSNLAKKDCTFLSNKIIKNESIFQAIGVYQNTNKSEIIIFISRRATTEEGEILLNGDREFNTTAFFIIDTKNIDFKKISLKSIANFLFHYKIPYFREKSELTQKKWTIDENIIDSLFQINIKSKIIYKYQSVANLLISLILSGKKAIISISNNQATLVEKINYSFDLIDNILYFLPNFYRKRISVAFGYVDENSCNFSNFIIPIKSINKELTADSSHPRAIVRITIRDDEIILENNHIKSSDYFTDFIQYPVENLGVDINKIIYHLENSINEFDIISFCNKEALIFILEYPSNENYKKFLLEKYPNAINNVHEISDTLFISSAALLFNFLKISSPDKTIAFLLRLSQLNPEILFNGINKHLALPDVEGKKHIWWMQYLIKEDKLFDFLLASTEKKNLDINKIIILVLNGEQAKQEKIQLVGKIKETLPKYNIKVDVNFDFQLNDLIDFNTIEKVIDYIIKKLDILVLINSHFFLKLDQQKKEKLKTIYEKNNTISISSMLKVFEYFEINNNNCDSILKEIMSYHELSDLDIKKITLFSLDKSINENADFLFNTFCGFYDSLIKFNENIFNALSTIKSNQDQKYNWYNYENLVNELGGFTNIELLCFFDKKLSIKYTPELTYIWLKTIQSANTIEKSYLENKFINSTCFGRIENINIFSDMETKYLELLLIIILKYEKFSDYSIAVDSIILKWLHGKTKINEELWSLLIKNHYNNKTLNKHDYNMHINFLLIKIKLYQTPYLPFFIIHESDKPILSSKIAETLEAINLDHDDFEKRLNQMKNIINDFKIDLFSVVEKINSKKILEYILTEKIDSFEMTIENIKKMLVIVSRKIINDDIRNMYLRIAGQFLLERLKNDKEGHDILALILANKGFRI